MTACAHLLDQAHPEAHFVQLYGSDDRLLTRNVAHFLREGLRRGDGLVVIASPEHGGSVARQLGDEVGFAKAVLGGRLAFLDARSTLDRLLVDGQPDPDRFETVIGGALAEVQRRAGHTGVRAYGEMVGVLWEAGEHKAAAALEGLWNRRLKSSGIRLFCGYPIDVFGDEFRADRIDPLLCAHTHLLPVDDALESALELAMHQVLGQRLEGLRTLLRANHRPSWGEIPRAESLILWLRNNLPGSAAEILHLARGYYQSAASVRA